VASEGRSLESLREVNRLRVVGALRHHGRLSRAEISRVTGLSRATVSTLVGDLHARGFLLERSDGQSARSGKGRPPTLLQLDSSAGNVVGIDFSHDVIRVAVSDLSRTVLAEGHTPFDVDHDAAGAMDRAHELVDEALAEAGIGIDQVLGVGTALAGPIDSTRMHAHPSAILPGWTDVAVTEELRDRLGVPVHLDNDANLGALAEVTLGAGRSAGTAVYVQMSSGIGAGLIVDGRPFRGAFGLAGEIGHIAVDETGEICRCGNRGCLETIASGPAIASLVETSRSGPLTTLDLVALAQEGDLRARRAIADAGLAVGRAVGAVCNIFNPEMVVVGGDLSATGELLVGPLREGVMRAALPAASRDLDVVAGELGERANVLGALALAIAQSEQAVAARIGAAGVGQ
jgi:predicted NBD/HSP70 family sugar kinase